MIFRSPHYDILNVDRLVSDRVNNVDFVPMLCMKSSLIGFSKAVNNRHPFATVVSIITWSRAMVHLVDTVIAVGLL